MLLPVIVGVLGHALLCRENYALSMELLVTLWRDGQRMVCGGAVSGILAAVLLAGFGKIVLSIVFSLALVGCIFGAFHLSPRKMAQAVRQRREDRLAEQAQWDEEEEMELLLPVKSKSSTGKRVATPRKNIDIALDDEPETKPEASIAVRT